MNKSLQNLSRNIVLVASMVLVVQAQAEVLCKDKKTSVVVSRKSCKKSEAALTAVQVNAKSSAKAAGTSTAASVVVNDTGAISSGSDLSTGLDVSVTRTGATGGVINNTGIDVSVTSDAGGDTTNVGLSVSAAGGDTNYAALFQGGNVGIGVSDPDEQLELTGRLHLGQTAAPAVTTDKLYNVGGVLYWGGQSVAVGEGSGSGTITGVTAGNGLSGGGTSGAVTLAVDAGTNANQIIQLNSSGELPAVNGVNLTNLNGSAINSGTVSDARLSGNVSLLGSSIALGSETSGILSVANGGTGASSLTNLIALGTQTTGNYVTSVATGSGLSGGASASEGAALSLTVDQTFAPTWTGMHSFQGGANFGTTTASTEMMHLNGRMQIEPGSAPVTTTDRLYNVAGDLFFNGQNLSDTAAGGDITRIIAGTGLTTPDGTTGDVTLNVDVGTTANKIVQLNGSAALPAVSGANLTALNASNLASGTVPDGLLSANVSKLGGDIGLASSEVSGTLPVANGGTGATSLVNLIALTTNTTGNYVGSVTAGNGITVGGSPGEGVTATVTLDEAYAPEWTATHTFSGVATDITTDTNEDFAIMPNGTGKVGIGTTSPSAMLDTVYTSTSTTGAVETGAEFNFTDTGIVTALTDTSTGVDVNVSRTGASGGTINTTGVDVSVTGSSGGTSKAIGLNVAVSGADTNYAALFSGGNVGIGTSAPTAQLESVSGSSSTSAGTETGAIISFTDTGAVAAGTDITNGLSVSVIRNSSSGADTDTTGLVLTVTGDAGGAGTTVGTGLEVTVSGSDQNVAASFNGGSVAIDDPVSVISPNIPSGSLVLGNGTLCVDNGATNCDDAARNAGTIYANNNTVANVDLAEEFPIETGDLLEPGDVVMIDSHVGSKCVELVEQTKGASSEQACARSTKGIIPFVTRAANSAAAKRVIGIVSTAPGLTLGGFGQEELVGYKKVAVALAGRVPVKISLENGPIEVGDRIQVSSASGVAMRSERDSGPGVIGIALEPYSQGMATDRILVLVK